MDSVRFGRALGIGARLAAKTLVSAVDAAAAPNPSAPANRPSATPHRPTTAAPPRPPTTPPTASRSSQSPARGIVHGTRRFGEAVWGPVVKLSGVLWLELTGTFFGLFALFAATGAWKLRDNLHRTPANADSNTHLLLALGMTLLFGYFCATSFLRANLRSRRR